MRCRISTEPLVAKWEQWYASRPDYVARMIDRSRRYLYYIVVEVEERGMPLELALLPMVESAYNPTALSTSRASGIWQFMPSTGIASTASSRISGSTRGATSSPRPTGARLPGEALRRFRRLAARARRLQLGRRQRRQGRRNQPEGPQADRLTRASQMPDETRNYLPKLQAVKNIIRDPDKYGLTLADIPDAPYFAVVKTNRKMDVKRAAELAEMLARRIPVPQSAAQPAGDRRAPTNTRSCCRSTRPRCSRRSSSSPTSRWCRGRPTG